MGFPWHKFAELAKQFAPLVLPMIPGVPPEIIPYIGPAIATAETIPGATGPEKLSAAVAITQAGFTAAQAAGAHVDATVTNAAIVDGVNAVVKAVNGFHTAPAPKI